MIPYNLLITYYKNELEMKIMILDDIIMIKKFTVNHDDEHTFKTSLFNNLSLCMKDKKSILINYYQNECIMYDCHKEILTFLSADNCTINFNLFDVEDINNRRQQFALEFDKVGKFGNCISK